MAEIDSVIEKLLGEPVPLAEAAKKLPAEAGLYAWWTKSGALPAVPPCPHPSIEGVDLFYVGRAPRDAESTATLRSRIHDNHIGGNTGSSTFRLTLASLLFEAQGWRPRMTSRALLTSEDNKALTAWQHEHLRLTWIVRKRPWEIEHDVIHRLGPPLNLAGNKAHPFATTVSAARKRFKEAALPATAPSSVPPMTVSGEIKSRGKITLHEEIINILHSHGGGWMTTQEIADEVAERGIYIKRDGTSDVSAFQVHGRTKNYPDLFERDGSRVRLRQP